MLNRTVASIAWIVSGALAAFAQPAPKLPPCSQSMIVGTWQAIFTPGASNPVAPGFPLYPNFACPVNISSNGSLTASNCTLTDNFAITQQPAGMLTIDRTCHAVGSLTYNMCNQTNGPCPSPNDYAWSCSSGAKGCGRTPPPSVLPFELIEIRRDAPSDQT
jgi:hypothetical protein